MLYKLSLIFLYTLFGRSLCSSDNVLWGVHPSEIYLYKPAEEFKCKDEKATIPYAKVNDNYCDCADGSDEPSTSACTLGVFYCLNKGYLGHMIPSNRVNDGVCDCCDGSDEYASNTCKNTCTELEEKKRKEGVTADSFEIEEEDEDEHDDNDSVYRAHMVHMGSRKQQEKLERLRKLELEKALAEETVKELEKLTKTAETKANNALDGLKNDPFEDKEEAKSVEDRYAHDAFESLDLNKDGILDLEEIKQEEIFDLNKNMVIEDREVKWYYDAMPGIANEELFRKKMWRKMGRLYVLEKKLNEAVKFEFNMQKLEEEDPPQRKKEEKRQKRSDTPKTNDDEDVDIVDMDAEEEFQNLGNMEFLDDETKKILEQAQNARNQLNDARRQFREAKRVKEEFEQTLFEGDPDDEDRNEGIVEHLENFGPDERSKYFPMRMHCYKYHTKEFTYRMCPFFGCTQNPKRKSNNDVIDLGKWVGWGKEGDEPIMVFKHGDYCNNGLRRASRVRIYCGSRNLLVHVEETEMCKYRMEFKSPAGCHIRNLKEANFTFTSHDEL